MSDNSNADTEADEQTVAELKERIGELEERVEQQEAQRGTSRRQFLGSLTGIASAGAAGYYLGTQRASADPSWGSATGQVGTQSTPFQQVISQTGTFESLSTEQASIGATTLSPKDSPYTLADDSVIAVDMTDESIFFLTGNRTAVSGVFVSDFNRLNDGILESSTTNQGGGTTLNGTTGPDGSVNVSKNDWTLYIENRIGSDATIDIITLTR